MNKHWYELVNADGDVILEITSGFTNLDKEEYFDKHLAGETLAGMSKAYGERVFVASWNYVEDI